MTIKMFFDQSFREKNGHQTYNALRRILAHVQNYYLWPSLNTTFAFSAHYTEELPLYLAEYSLEDALLESIFIFT